MRWSLLSRARRDCQGSVSQIDCTMTARSGAPDGAWSCTGNPGSPEEGPMRGVVMIVHGIGEHSGEYGHVVERLVPAGFAVYGFDLRGHGRSPGRRAFIRSWDDYRQDVRAFLSLVARSSRGSRTSCWGTASAGSSCSITPCAIPRASWCHRPRPSYWRGGHLAGADDALARIIHASGRPFRCVPVWTPAPSRAILRWSPPTRPIRWCTTAAPHGWESKPSGPSTSPLPRRRIAACRCDPARRRRPHRRARRQPSLHR